MQAIEERLRSVAVSIRTKPTPLSEFIPLLNQSADHIDKLEAENERLRKDAERRPMTDEEIQSAWDMAVGPYGHVAGLYKRGIARAVEAFHGIKGTP